MLVRLRELLIRQGASWRSQGNWVPIQDYAGLTADLHRYEVDMASRTFETRWYQPAPWWPMAA